MRVLVTGSTGHLGEALVRTLTSEGHNVVGLDIIASPFTTHVGSITDHACVKECVAGVDAVFHTAALHKPHIATNAPQEFFNVNVAGTLNLLEEAVDAGVTSFVFTSTTSVFGAAMPLIPKGPAVWVTEGVRPIPANIYGMTKIAAEDLCELFHRRYALAALILRTSRFFPEEDDDRELRSTYDDMNIRPTSFFIGASTFTMSLTPICEPQNWRQHLDSVGTSSVRPAPSRLVTSTICALMPRES